MMQEYKVNLYLNASRHPQANPVERTNRTIISMIRAYIGDNHRHWDKDLPQLGFALRSAVHETTGFSPAFLTFGRELNATSEGYALLNDQSQLPVDGDNCKDHVTKLQKLKDIIPLVKYRLDTAHSKSAGRYNLRRRDVAFKEKDLVLKRNFVQSNAASYFTSKLAPRFVGPYRIIKKSSPVTYCLQSLEGKHLGTWHVQDLKPYVQ